MSVFMCAKEVRVLDLGSRLVEELGVKPIFQIRSVYHYRICFQYLDSDAADFADLRYSDEES